METFFEKKKRRHLHQRSNAGSLMVEPYHMLALCLQFSGAIFAPWLPSSYRHGDPPWSGDQVPVRGWTQVPGPEPRTRSPARL
ncbi:hypothetical protein EYF80_006264 [Liparis tanakae]|uniref:Uncharacterized protein n=1 Tax=Liparis tanakae TaxID=230148 RepID=A0A4Z2J1H1_9TELE|nr:hypothetical protein EYF80_006264 [Liparis tanakae]